MTAENDGTGATPEGDDPFAYLYRQEGGEGSPAPQSGAPRRSYNQVRAVGERQYGGYGGQYGGQHGGGAGTQQTAAYGQQPNAHYAAPETMPGGRAAAQQSPGGHGGGNGHGAPGGRSRNGLLIGALSVVAAVVIGIGAAIYFNSGGEEGQDAGATAGAGAGDGGKGQDQDQDTGADKPSKGELIGEKQDASGFQLAGGAAAASDIPGAASKDGSYVGSMNVTGASATWSADVPEAGAYTLFVRYGVPGKDANSTLTINGQPASQPLNMSNFGKAQEGDWEKGWTRTWAWVSLKQGSNTFKLSCEQGNKCDFNLDQAWLKAGKVKR
ncbi:hypothetical protein [Streptomyces sp. WMMB 322]|uniref:hypothetical protein n=1 Tax=Streptomyces sp. WMMB 322 TaxID=1286821 RepID=UPI0006E1A8DD|nr:hypothetical protein [Streptomyces sp. WMMB 322]SCK06645.1 hypothetical protein H180DRAFT_00195 [Streptomyces sp. WMMB 322]